MLFYTFLLISLANLVFSNYFRGGSISWKFLSETSNKVQVEFYSTWYWRLSYFYINKNPTVGDIVKAQESLYCRVGCNQNINAVQLEVIKFSFDDDWISGNYKWTENLPKSDLIIISFAGCCWYSLNSNKLNFEVGVLINTNKRSDTSSVNSSPKSEMEPILNITHGSVFQYKIPLTDPDNDIVKCRWGNRSLHECADTCYTHTFITLNSSSCEIFINANQISIGWYGVSITAEDFSNQNSALALSSIGIHFLVEVRVASGNYCVSKPIIKDNLNKTVFKFYTNRAFNFEIIFEIKCPEANFSRLEIYGPTNINYSTPINIYNTTYKSNLTWVPYSHQSGIHIICVRIVDSLNLTSNYKCYEIVVEKTTGWFTIKCTIRKSRRHQNGTIEIVEKNINYLHACDLLEDYSEFVNTSYKENDQQQNKSNEIIYFRINSFEITHSLVRQCYGYLGIILVGLFLSFFIISDCFKILAKIKKLLFT